MHRYFPERADLVRAVARHVARRSLQAIEEAEPHTGPVEATMTTLTRGVYGADTAP